MALVWLAGGADDAPPPAPPDGPVPMAAPAAPAQPAHLDEPQLWRLVEDARRDAGGDAERQSELLAARLEQLPAQQIADSGRPRGEVWDDEQQDELVGRYPALAARFR